MSAKLAYAGIDIGGTNIKFGLVDTSGKVLYREQRPTMVEKGADPLMHLITNISESLMFHAAEEELEVRWLGVGTPGGVDAKAGRVLGPCPNIPGWEGMEVGSILKERLNMPVFVDNDANVVALAESRFGAALGYKSVVCVTLGTGVGGGLILDGKLWRGCSGAAGEIGQMSINFDGPPCMGENAGCIESYCASQAIIKRVKAKLNNELTPIFNEVCSGDIEALSIKRIFTALRKGDEIARSAIMETARFLGIGLSGVVNLLNPEIVILGGGIADGGSEFVEAVASEIKKRSFKSAVDRLRVARATLGNDAGFIGAGILGDI
jgi:glucokinase